MGNGADVRVQYVYNNGNNMNNANNAYNMNQTQNSYMEKVRKYFYIYTKKA